MRLRPVSFSTAFGVLVLASCGGNAGQNNNDLSLGNSTTSSNALNAVTTQDAPERALLNVSAPEDDPISAEASAEAASESIDLEGEPSNDAESAQTTSESTRSTTTVATGRTPGTEPAPPATSSSGSATTVRSSSDAILSADFENRSPGVYQESMLADDLSWRENWATGIDKGRFNIVEEGGNTFLRVSYPEGTRGGGGWECDLGGPHEQLYLTYQVRFVGDVDFRDGGKLPGLAGGTAPTGGKSSADGLGFTARFVWRNTRSNHDAYFTQYMYDMDKESGTGRHVTLGDDPIYLQTDHWYTIVSKITMNTPGQKDGRVEAWLDGVKVLDMPAELRSRSDLGIDMMYFSTFFGGGDVPEYQTTKDEYFDFDNFYVSASPEGLRIS